MARRFWLMKSEASCYSIDDLKRDGTAYWDGIRNYQARNYLRDDVRVGDLVLFYHSNSEPTGIAGIAEVTKASYPDFTAWDSRHEHFDPKTDPENPVWVMVDLSFKEKFPATVTLERLKSDPAFDGMLVIKRRQRLSVMPVEEAHFNRAVEAGREG